MLTREHTEALERALGRIVADAQRQVDLHRAQSDAIIADLRARLVETEARLAQFEARVAQSVDERLTAAEEATAAMVREMLEPLERASPDETAALIRSLIDGAVQERVGEALAALPSPEPVDLSGLATKAEVDEIRAALAVPPEFPPAPDLSGFATKDEVQAVRDAIPAPMEAPDLSPFATREELDEVRAAIPEIPEAPDLSGFATIEAVEEVRASIPEIPEAPDLSGFATRDEVAEIRAAIPVIPEPKDWQPAIDAVREEAEWAAAEGKAEVGRVLAEVKERLERHPGRFPVVRAYEDGVHYAGDLVTHAGSLWQAKRDTGKAPPHDDWAVVAAKGDRGDPGASPKVRGTYNADEEYRALDVVALDGSSFIARHDEPGPCPGEGWQLVASRGGRGKPGDSVRGEPGKPVVAMDVSDDGLLTLTNGDGSTVEADLYPLLEKVAR